MCTMYACVYIYTHIITYSAFRLVYQNVSQLEPYRFRRRKGIVNAAHLPENVSCLGITKTVSYSTVSTMQSSKTHEKRKGTVFLQMVLSFPC